MNPHLIDTYLRPILARVIAAGMVPLCAWLATKFGVVFSPEAQQEIAIATVSLVIYALSHKVINTAVNPTDAAKVTRPASTPAKEPDAAG